MDADPDYISRYHNARVTVYYLGQTTYNDTGVVTYLGEQWIELKKANDECLLIPVSAIRLIKVLDALEPAGEAGLLLRATDEGRGR